VALAPGLFLVRLIAHRAPPRHSRLPPQRYGRPSPRTHLAHQRDHLPAQPRRRTQRRGEKGGMIDSTARRADSGSFVSRAPRLAGIGYRQEPADIARHRMTDPDDRTRERNWPGGGPQGSLGGPGRQLPDRPWCRVRRCTITGPARGPRLCAVSPPPPKSGHGRTPPVLPSPAAASSGPRSGPPGAQRTAAEAARHNDVGAESLIHVIRPGDIR